MKEVKEQDEKNGDLKLAMMRVEEDIKVWKRKFKEMEKMVSRLEVETE